VNSPARYLSGMRIWETVSASGNDGEDHRVLLAAISQMRIPLKYLAGLFTAGATAPVEPEALTASTTGDRGGMYQTIGSVRYSGCRGRAI
jgi:hypothetical protein